VDETRQRLGRLALAAQRSRDAWVDAREARDRAITSAEAGGWTVREIADATELSSAQIGRIIVAQAAARQG
jgi:hypothetical protein